MSAAIIGIGAGLYMFNESQGSMDTAIAGTQASQDEANRIAQQQLDFNMQNYEDQMQAVADLEEIFGPIRENLDKYYKDMSVEQIQLRGKEHIEKQYERSNENIDKLFSNNGMYSSGQRVSAQVALEAAREETMGANLLKAEESFVGQQTNWLAHGLDEKNAARGMATNTAGYINQAYSNQANTTLAGANTRANLYTQEAQGYGDISSGFFNLAGYGMGGGFNSPTLNNDENLMPGSNRTWGQGGNT